MKNYYKLLGINKKASKQQINAAFKRLSLQYHPDRNGGDTSYVELFKELNEAKQVLISDERRAEYDLDLKMHSFPRRLFINPGEDYNAGDYYIFKYRLFGMAKWMVTVIGLAVAIMYILIAIDNATTIFSPDREKYLEDREFSNGSLFLPGNKSVKHSK